VSWGGFAAFAAAQSDPGINEHDVTRAMKERHRIGGPRKMPLAGGDSLGGAAASW